MRCRGCGTKYIQWSRGIENNLCLPCNDKEWAKWEIEEADNLKEIKRLQTKEHSHHCACRQVWGDGECECDLYAKGYDPYAWIEQVKFNPMPKGNK